MVSPQEAGPINKDRYSTAFTRDAWDVGPEYMAELMERLSQKLLDRMAIHFEEGVSSVRIDIEISGINK